MSRDCSVTLTWADGEYTFRLKLGQLRELQEKCDAGPNELLMRTFAGNWRVDDIREPIRLGLIGVSTKPADALKLVMRYVDEYPLGESVLVAQAILAACVHGVPDEEPGKPQAAKADGADPASFPEGNSPLPQSTEQEPS